MDGKVDWMAYGLPVEGQDGPFIGGEVVELPTCDVGATVADARRVLEQAGGDSLVVLAGDGLAVGEVDTETLGGHGDDEALLDVMDPVPSTYRPSVTFQAMAEEGGGRFLVSTPDGRLLGGVEVEAGDHGDNHDHGDDHDHGHADFERELDEVLAAIGERFGDREPSEEELRSFLRDRLIDEGRSPEEADKLLDELQSD